MRKSDAKPLRSLLFTPGDQEGFGPAGIIGSILGAILVLLIYRWTRSRSGRRTYV